MSDYILLDAKALLQELRTNGFYPYLQGAGELDSAINNKIISVFIDFNNHLAQTIDRCAIPEDEFMIVRITKDDDEADDGDICDEETLI